MTEFRAPGNKSNQSSLNAFARKARDVLAAGIHLLVVDLFPPPVRDPEGIHPVIWGDGGGDEFSFTADKPLTCAAYAGGAGASAFIEPLAVGDALRDMPLFLAPDVYVETPLEPTYRAAWDGMPAYWRDVLTTVGQ